MRIGRAVLLSLGAACLAASPAFSQAPRQDFIWAKRSLANITLNGSLSEPAWAKAESIVVNFGVINGIPGSGWKYEGGVIPNNPTKATLKFLIVGNQLYLGARVVDKSIGGSRDFNRFDGFLMSLKDHSSLGAPKPPAEYLYSWWSPDTTAAISTVPTYLGRWGNPFGALPRTAEQIANWEAATVVNGTVNSDAVQDVGYTVEMRFNLTPMGYDATKPEGDILEWNISVYDCDWLWPLNVSTLAYNRVWWQSPWGNAMWYDEVHIFTRPDVSTASTILPTVRPEVYVPNGAAFAAPTIDGNLSDAAWASAYSFHIKFGDDAIRAGYPGVGPSRGGQYQPTVNGGVAAILDPNDAIVKMFWRDNNLFLGFDVADQVVQYHPTIDRWDGFIVSLTDRTAIDPIDNVYRNRRLSFQVGPTGAALAADYLATLIGAGTGQVAIQLKGGTTVDTLGTSADTGYTAEMRVDLTAIGYPPGLGDKSLFIGVNALDGDSFTPFTDSYGTRTWWFKEFEGQCCPAWAFLSSAAPTDNGSDPTAEAISDYKVLGTFPNPARNSTIRYALPRPSRVTLDVFDVAGRLIETRRLGVMAKGVQEAFFDGRGRAPGVYLYRLNLENPETGAQLKQLTGRVTVLR